MEEILKNIYSESESFMLENNGSADTSSIVGDAGNGGAMMNGSENENKTVEEVWRVLETGGGRGRGSGEPTMTLEDFLAKAGAVSVEDVKVSAVETTAPLPAKAAFGMETTMQNATVGVAVAQFAPSVCMQNGPTDGGFPVEFGNGMLAVGGSGGRGKRSEEDVRFSAVVTMAPPPAMAAFGMEAIMKNETMGVEVAQFAPAVCMQNGPTDGGLGVEFGNGMVAVGGSTGGAGRGKRRVALEEAPLDKATQQRQKRMIKNRESAARSRERKQAYTVELESLVTQLEEENARLLKEEAWLNKERYKQLMENLIPVTEKRRPPRVLRRVCSMIW